MAHQHGDPHHHDHSHATGNIGVAFLLNTFFALVEIAGGLYTNSVAILSDALHDFGDSLTLGIAWYFQKKSLRRPDEKYSYGYRRFSVAGAFISSIILVIGSVFIIMESISRLRDPEKADAKGMLVLAVFGLGVNLAAMLRLRKGNTVNEKAIALHFLEDVLGWAAVQIGAVVMLFADVPVLDPILSLCIAVFILFNVYKNISSALRIVLQGVPADVSEQEIRAHLSEITEISDIHDFRVWSLDGIYNVLTLHATVSPRLTMEESEGLKKRIRNKLSHLNIRHVTIELESRGASCQQLEENK
jgi:cobalt-zinc-cadmium efflux system protein